MCQWAAGPDFQLDLALPGDQWEKVERTWWGWGIYSFSQFPLLWGPQGRAASRGLHSSKAALSTVVSISPIPVKPTPSSAPKGQRSGHGAPLLPIWGSAQCLMVSLHSAHACVNSFFMKLGLRMPSTDTPRKFDFLWVECFCLVIFLCSCHLNHSSAQWRKSQFLKLHKTGFISHSTFYS